MNKKIILPIVLISMLVIGMATASLVSYLSNTAKVSVTVESPVLLEVSISGVDGEWKSGNPATLSLGSVYGGEEITFFVRDTNLANVSTPGNSTKLVTCDTGVTCDDFASVMAEGTDLLTLPDGCVNIDWKTVDFSKYTSNGLDAGESTTTEIVMAFKPNALGTYVFTMQKMLPE